MLRISRPVLFMSSSQSELKNNKTIADLTSFNRSFSLCWYKWKHKLRICAFKFKMTFFFRSENTYNVCEDILFRSQVILYVYRSICRWQVEKVRCWAKSCSLIAKRTYWLKEKLTCSFRICHMYMSLAINHKKINIKIF